MNIDCGPVDIKKPSGRESAKESVISPSLFREAPLLVWLSPGFPIGAFAYSHGLEWAFEAGDIKPGADGLWAVDTWQGCRTPHRNPAARGMWGGLTLAHTRAHLFRATLESVAFGGRAVLETLEEAGVDARELVVTGGAARSSVWPMAVLRGDIAQYTCLMGTTVQEIYNTHPDLRAACDRGMSEHVAIIE